MDPGATLVIRQILENQFISVNIDRCASVIIGNQYNFLYIDACPCPSECLVSLIKIIGILLNLVVLSSRCLCLAGKDHKL